MLALAILEAQSLRIVGSSSNLLRTLSFFQSAIRMWTCASVDALSLSSTMVSRDFLSLPRAVHDLLVGDNQLRYRVFVVTSNA